MVTVDEARVKVAEAQAGVEAVQAEFEEHVKRNRMAEALNAAQAVTAAQKILDAANNVVLKLEFESKAEERNAASATLKTAIDSLIASDTWTQAAALGVTGFTVSQGTEGLNVAIRTIAEPKAARKANPDATGGTSGRLVHVVDGTEYSSRELLTKYYEELFGAEATTAMWERQAAGGGFDAAVKKLNKALAEKGHAVQLMKKVEGQLLPA